MIQALCSVWQLCPGSSGLPFIVMDLGQQKLEQERVSMRREVNTGTRRGRGQGPEKQLCMDSGR